MSNSITVQLLCGGFCANRKCGADFVYLQRGSDKTLTKINDDAIPHTCVDMDKHTENMPCHILTRKECRSLSFSQLKLSDSFVRTCENTF